MNSSVISRHWPACCDRAGLTIESVAPGRLRGIIGDLCELRVHLALERMADAKVATAIDALREAEEAQRTTAG